jgi:hypothetical protein
MALRQNSRSADTAVLLERPGPTASICIYL